MLRSDGTDKKARKGIAPLAAAKTSLSLALSASLAFMAVPATALAATPDPELEAAQAAVEAADDAQAADAAGEGDAQPGSEGATAQAEATGDTQAADVEGTGDAQLAGGAVQPGEGDAQLLDEGADFETDISKSGTITVSGTEGNTYTGFALDPITMSDSANLNWDGSAKELTKSLERDEGDWGFYDYVVEYENNRDVGTARYTITGGLDAGAVSWASSYTGTKTGTFEIAPADLAQAKAVALADGEKDTQLLSSNPKPKMKVALASHQEYQGSDPETGAAVYADVPDFMESDADFTLVYRDSTGAQVDDITAAGDYTVEAVAASGNVTGTSPRVGFKVVDTAIPLAGAVFSAIADQPYEGGAVEPEFTVTLDGVVLEKGIDYTVEYSQNDKPGMATATIHGIGIYEGSASTTFQIVKGDIAIAQVGIDHLATYDSLPFTGATMEPGVSVTVRKTHRDDSWNEVVDLEATLEEGVDYTVEYVNTDAVWKASNLRDSDETDETYPADKQPKVIVKGMGAFEGEISKEFSILPACDISGARISGLGGSTFTGRAQAVTPAQASTAYINLLPKYNICAYGLKDAEGVAYSVAYQDAAGNPIEAGDIVDAGAYKMVLTGLESGGFFGTKVVDFAIAPADFSSVEVAAVPEQAPSLDGSYPAPVPAITYAAGAGEDAYALVAGKDFDVDYEYPEEVGGTHASLTVTPKGNFTGSAHKVNFRIGAISTVPATMEAPVTWASSTGADWTARMSAATTDGKVAIAKNEAGGYDVTLKPSNAMVAGLQYPKGVDVAGNGDGSFTIAVDDLTRALNIYVSVPASPNRGYDGFMTIDLAQAEFALEEGKVYAADVSWQQENGSASMVQNAGYIPQAYVEKTAGGYRAALQPTDEAKQLISAINGISEEPYLVDVADLSGRTPVDFTVAAMGSTMRAYLVFDLAADLADKARQARARVMADAAVTVIDTLPAEATVADRAHVAAVRAFYNVLTDEQKALVPSEKLAKLTAAEDVIARADAQAAELAAAQAAANKTKVAIDKAAKTCLAADVDAAKKSYAALSELAKSFVGSDYVAKLNAAAGKVVTKSLSCAVSGQAYKVTAAATAGANGTVTLTKAKNAKSVTVPATVKLKDGQTYRVTAVAASAFTGSSIRTVTIGSNVAKIASGAFRSSKATTVVVKTKSLTKAATVKGAFSKSKIATVQVKVGSAADNKKFVKAYKKVFTKANTDTSAKTLTVK